MIPGHETATKATTLATTKREGRTMKRRYKILIAIVSVLAAALAAHFGGRALVDWIIALHA